VVLEGAVRKAGDRLRVTVQLVDVGAGYQRWSHRFDGVLSDIFAMQDEIASRVATLLRGFLSTRAQDALRRPGTTPEAYEHFLKGRQLLSVLTSTSLVAAKEALERAVELDPVYAPAYAALAQLHAWNAERLGGGEGAAAAADRASANAVEHGPQLAEAHVARAVVLGMRRAYEAAAREYEEALRLNPQSFDAYFGYAAVCFQTGKDEQAVELYRRAAEVRVEDFQCLSISAMSLRRLGRVEEARAAALEGLRRAERALEVDPGNARALALGACSLVDVGELDRAGQWARRALDLAPDEPSVNVGVACVYLRMGDNERALDRLEGTFGRGIGKRDWVDHDPDYDSVRDDPRFQALVAKLA
jgi:tetratricopeptide (TPR) repeat protein